MTTTTLLNRRADTATLATVHADSGDARTITVRLCRWDAVSNPVSGFDHPEPYREVVRRGAVSLADSVHVVDTHHGQLIGRALPDTLDDDGTGPTVDVLVARTQAGSDLLALLDADVVQSVSMEYEPLTPTEVVDGIVERTALRVHGIAFAFRPGHDAPVTHREETPMTDQNTTTPVDAPVTVVTEQVTPDMLDRAMDDMRRELHAIGQQQAPAGHPAAAYGSFGEYFLARYEDAGVPLLNRVLTDQISDDNPGVIPPSWATMVYGIVTQSRPVISSFGVRSAGDSGMSIDYPYLDPALDLDTVVGEQLAEKTAVTSVKVSMLRGSDDLRTWAAASDISMQLLTRSRPEYLDAYLRVLMSGYARTTDLAATDTVEKGAGAATVYDVASDSDGTAFKSWLFGASVDVEDATGMPASFCLVASDVYKKMGGVLASQSYGTQNVPGAGSAATLQVSVHGIPLVHARGLTAGSVVASNGMAAGWHEDGPSTITETDVEKLGQNTGIWGLGVMAVNVPAGVQLGNAGGVVPTSQAAQSSKKK